MAAEGNEGSGVGWMAIAYLLAGFARMWEGAKSLAAAPFRDGTLAAAGRQGLDELGEALKPFPESIQVHESGTIWNPTQGEIAADRRDQPATRSPSRIASTNRTTTLYGNHTAVRTPSQIAADNQHQPHSPEQSHDHQHGHDI